MHIFTSQVIQHNLTFSRK